MLGFLGPVNSDIATHPRGMAFELMPTRHAIFSLIAASPQFADLDPTVLRTIAARCRPKVFLIGQMVFMEGDPCRNLCILESGRVKFFRMNAEGREQILKVFERPSDIFCIASAFSTGIHIVSARVAETDSNFGLVLPWWDRLFGTYRAEPAAGQAQLVVGIDSFRTNRDLWLDRLVLNPLLDERGS
jgi:Cyclic nucleotide-binding domain